MKLLTFSARAFLLLGLAFIPRFPLIGVNPTENGEQPVAYQKYSQSAEESRWVDSVFQTLNTDQQIGQLFMQPVLPQNDAGQDALTQKLISQYHLGGIIFMKGNAEIQVSLVNKYQQLARLPLMVAQDAEWGEAMRLEGVTKFPKNLALGAIQDDSLLYSFGRAIARQCKQVGVQVNFAPVVDVNNNAANPVIGDRSFGENKYNVVRKAWMMSKGMMSENVLPCAKHFPGHGDTDKDSHHELPLIRHSRQRLDTLELYPFYQMVQYGLPSMMIAHLNIPALEPTAGLPSSLSPAIVNDLLRKKMDYDGLVFTDGLNMEGVAKQFGTGEVELRAVKAGVDVLLISKDMPTAFNRLKTALADGEITKERLETSVKRILRAKYRLSLTQRPYTPVGATMGMLNASENLVLKKKLYEAAVTLVKNDNKLVPLDALESLKIACVQIGGTQGGTFVRTLQKYASVKAFYLPTNPTEADLNNTLAALKGYNTVIMGVFGVENKKPRENYEISANTGILAKRLASAANVKTITALFGTPYALKNFGNEMALFVGYDDDPDMQQATAAAIFGGLTVSGKLPVTASPQFREGMGFEIPYVTRFGFALPEEMNMSRWVLNKIDSVARQVTQMRIVPGFSVVALRGNKIVWEKGYGKTDYSAVADSIDPLRHTYDLASVTKICATTTVAMQLYEQGLLDLDRTVGDYLPDFKYSNKSYITVRELLQHTSGLKAWIPFYLSTFSDAAKTQLRKDLYSTTYSEAYSIEVAPRLYLRTSYRDTIWQAIKYSDLGPKNKLVYSDLSMIILGKIIEKIVGDELDDYVCTHFYQPLGMYQTTYNPAKKGQGEKCPPTEIDNEWRRCVVRGYVHDPAAAIMGGVSGNAGLFSTPYDVVKLLYMIKNGGQYGNRAFLSPETIGRFASKQVSYSKRGLGFDKPNSDPSRSGEVSPYASEQAYGHLGFTGNSVWIDPEYDLVFVFLSNRTYPNSKDKNFNRKHIRREVMDLVYESMMKKYQGRS